MNPAWGLAAWRVPSNSYSRTRFLSSKQHFARAAFKPTLRSTSSVRRDIASLTFGCIQATNTGPNDGGMGAWLASQVAAGTFNASQLLVDFHQVRVCGNKAMSQLSISPPTIVLELERRYELVCCTFRWGRWGSYLTAPLCCKLQATTCRCNMLDNTIFFAMGAIHHRDTFATCPHRCAVNVGYHKSNMRSSDTLFVQASGLTVRIWDHRHTRI